MICEEIRSRDAQIKRLEAEIAILKKVTKMTDSQIKAWTKAVIEIAEHLK